MKLVFQYKSPINAHYSLQTFHIYISHQTIAFFFYNSHFYPQCRMFDIDKLIVVDPPIWSKTVSHPVSSICYNSQGNMAGFTSSPGEISVMSIYDGEKVITLKQSYTTQDLTSCVFHPVEGEFLLCSSRDGFIFMFDIFTGELKSFARHLGSGLSTMTVDTYGENVAIGCVDGSIRIYDINTFQRTKSLVKISHRNTGSSLVVYDLMFFPDDGNIILSSSGGDKILFWDLRTGNSERTLVGPQVKGKGIDIYQNDIITASHRDHKQLEVYDYGTAKKIYDIPFDKPGFQPSLLNCCNISKNGQCLVAGGAGSKIAQAFDVSKRQPFGSTDPQLSPIISLAISPYGSSFICGTDSGSVKCYAIRVDTEC